MARFPSLLVVGATKAGTTALDEYLRQHPDLFFSSAREPNYFAFPDAQVPYRGHDGRPAPMARTSVTDTADYLALFRGAPPTAVLAETSPSYLYVHGTAGRIADRVDDPRLVVLLRDPVARAFSAYQHLLREGREPLAFEDGLAAEEDRIAAGWGILWRYVDAGRYATQLERYLTVFPRGHLLVLWHEDFAADPVASCQRVFAFADVDPAFVPDTGTRFNVSGAPRNRVLQRIVNPPPPVRRPLLAVVPARLRSRARRLHAEVSARNLDRLELDADTRTRLRATFAPEVARLEQLTGRSLTAWRGA